MRTDSTEESNAHDRLIQHCDNHGGRWDRGVVLLRLKLQPHRIAGGECKEFADPGRAQFEIVATGRDCALVICCPLLAQSGHRVAEFQRPLSGT